MSILPKLGKRTYDCRVLKLKEKIEIPDYILKAIELNDYAVQTRYPGDYTPVSKAEYEEALNIADSVVTWASDFVNGNVNRKRLYE